MPIHLPAEHATRLRPEKTMETDKMYIVTDGSLKGKFGSWSAIGYKFVEGEWKEIFSASAEDVPAKDSGQMELRGFMEGFSIYKNNYGDEKVVFRSDSQGLVDTVNRYMHCLKPHYSSHDEEQADQLRKEKIKRDKTKPHYVHRDEYAKLFAWLDEIVEQALHAQDRFAMEWVYRENRLLVNANNLARATNSAVGGLGLR